MSEASIATQWKKGQSGNPRGRPKKPELLKDQGEMLTHLARGLLDQPCHMLGAAGPAQITRQTRLMLDVLERAELGELACIKFLFELADRGDRRKLQALRAARRAPKPKDRQIEERFAAAIASLPPALGAEHQHLVAPAREPRTALVKPPKVPAGEPKYRENPYAFEPDPLAGIPKHLVHGSFARDEPEIAPPPDHGSGASRAEQANARSWPKAGPETGPETGLITGLQVGPRPNQTFDTARKSALRMSACDFSNFTAPPCGDEVVPMNGAR